MLVTAVPELSLEIFHPVADQVWILLKQLSALISQLKGYGCKTHQKSETSPLLWDQLSCLDPLKMSNWARQTQVCIKQKSSCKKGPGPGESFWWFAESTEKFFFIVGTGSWTYQEPEKAYCKTLIETSSSHEPRGTGFWFWEGHQEKGLSLYFIDTLFLLTSKLF